MDKKIIECVPNFSEGRDMGIIRQITDSIVAVDGVRLLDVDPGKDTNRTVVTFAGDPAAVAEAAYQAVKKASELIDMSRHHGEHPRMGATDVCPFVPVTGVTMEETVIIARNVAKRIGKALNIPVYCYENAAFTEQRRNLADCRSGEYEGLKDKLADPEWKPDFGPALFNEKSGATAIGARYFLVAFNVNLNTTSTRLANAVAFDVREKGRTIRKENGEAETLPGSLKKVKAIGWYIKEYGVAQISMNLTDISVTPVHAAFDEVCRKAAQRGLRVTGSELIGLIPMKAILDAGRFFLEQQHRSSGIADEELVKIAVRSMGLNDIHPFDPGKKIIENVLFEEGDSRLTKMDLSAFMNKTASESPAPGGGSVSAYIGALGVALGTMVANLSAHKRGWDERWREFSDWAVRGKIIQEKLLRFVDEDTDAFNEILKAYRMPKNSEEEIGIRLKTIKSATREATLIPFRVMETAFLGYELVDEMVEKGNPESVTDAAVGALAIRACIRGAFLNIKVNASGIDDKNFVNDLIERGREIENKALNEEAKILEKTAAIIIRKSKQ